MRKYMSRLNACIVNMGFQSLGTMYLCTQYNEMNTTTKKNWKETNNEWMWFIHISARHKD